MMWHEAYLRSVLRPDYDFACAHLLPALFDALSAHAWMLDAQGVSGAAQALELLRGLRRRPFPEYDPSVEDVFFTLDHQLAAHDEAAAGALRTALSRNDLDMTMYRLRARQDVLEAAGKVLTLRSTVLALAARELNTLIVAFTHHQPAQPSTLAHYLCAVENVLSRDTQRLNDSLRRINLSPMGAVALGGTSFPTDRQLTAELLAFDRPIENTYDAVSTSDWQVEVAGAVSAAATTLSRVLYDLLLWASRGLLVLADDLVQGSSVMPQKRNPVALEHARSKLSKAIGVMAGVTLSAHNIPFGDINDPSNDVQPLLQLMWQDFGEALDLISASLSAPLINREAWRAEAGRGEAVVTELADALARHQQSGFREAHTVVKALLTKLHQTDRTLIELEAGDFAAVGADVPEAVWRSALDPATFVARRTTYGGPAPETVSGHLEFARSRLETDAQQQQTATQRFAAARAKLEGQS